MFTKNTPQKEWTIGEVYAYKLRGNLAKGRGLLNRYLLVQKIAEEAWSARNNVPIVYVKMTRNDKLPTNVQEYDALEYIQTGLTRYENRFLPLDFSNLQEDIARKEKMSYQVDEYGYLPHYRATLLKRAYVSIPQELTYVGDFSDAIPPHNEFVPHMFLNHQLINWKRNAEFFEMLMVTAYCNHNLRELEIYRK